MAIGPIGMVLGVGKEPGGAFGAMMLGCDGPTVGLLTLTLAGSPLVIGKVGDALKMVLSTEMLCGWLGRIGVLECESSLAAALPSALGTGGGRVGAAFLGGPWLEWDVLTFLFAEDSFSPWSSFLGSVLSSLW